MGEDEEWTVRTLDTFKGVMKTIIPQHRGRVVDSTGDNLLAEFASVVDAVQAAVEIQQVLKAKNSLLPENRRMEFRIGINLGDVIEEGERIFGDGVNIAARLEGIAEAGGICISGSAFEQIENKLPLHYDYLGEHEVKNITRPVRVYRALMDNGGGKAKPVKPKEKGPQRKILVFCLAGALILISGVALWHFVQRPTSSSPPVASKTVEKADPQKMAYALPDMPSIAVLPFVNLSNDKEQEYFSDGITEDIITDLSANPYLFVIARNSTFSYKNKSLKIQQIAEELGVKFILESSVRKEGNQVRINAQLIDAMNGHHLWANRYDGELTDIFALQDKISQKIVSALNVRLSAGDKNGAEKKGTANIDAYDAFLKGWNYYRRNTREDWAKAISYFEKAIELDPNYSRAYAGISLIYWTYSRTSMPWSPDTELGVNYYEAIARAREYLDLAMKKPTPISYRVAASMALYRRQYKKAYEQAEQAIELDPNDVDGIYTMGYIALATGKHEKAVVLLEKCMRLDPNNIAQSLYLLGIAYFAKGQLENSVTSIERAMVHNPNLPMPVPILPAALALLGKDQEAQSALEALRKADPIGYKFQQIMFNFPFNDLEMIDRFVDGIRKAGLFAKDYNFYKLSQENMLNEEEIKKLFFGKKVFGSYSSVLKVHKFYIERTKDGKAHWTVPLNSLDYEDFGTSWIEDNMLCDRWQTHFFGNKYCMSIFRNSDGNRNKNNEYIAVSDSDFIEIALVD